MARTKKTVDKEALRQRRAVLYEAIEAGAVTLQHAVREMRAISRMTQAEFAAHRGVSTKVIKEIESGKGNPTIQTLNRIGQFFGLQVAFVRTETLREKKSPRRVAGRYRINRIDQKIRSSVPAPGSCHP